MRSLALAALLVGLSTTAFAADAPKIIGTWVPVSFTSAHDGTGGEFADEPNPVFTKDPGEGWTLTIDKQDGPAFSGTGKGGPKKTASSLAMLRASCVSSKEERCSGRPSRAWWHCSSI